MGILDDEPLITWVPLDVPLRRLLVFLQTLLPPTQVALWGIAGELEKLASRDSAEDVVADVHGVGQYAVDCLARPRPAATRRHFLLIELVGDVREALAVEVAGEHP